MKNVAISKPLVSAVEVVGVSGSSRTQCASLSSTILVFLLVCRITMRLCSPW